MSMYLTNGKMDCLASQIINGIFGFAAYERSEVFYTTRALDKLNSQICR